MAARRSPESATGTLTASVERDGQEIDVRFDFETTPGRPQTWESPAEPAYAEMFNVRRAETGAPVELTPAEVLRFEAMVWEELRERADGH